MWGILSTGAGKKFGQNLRREIPMKVAVIGLGRVGLPTACYFASLGHRVSGYDVDVGLRSMLSQGVNPLPWEPGVDKWLNSVQYVPTLEASLANVSCVYVIVPTPKVGDDLSAEHVKSVCQRIHDFGWTGWVVVGSTLDPRTVTEVCIHPSILYNPPLIRLGHVIEDLTYPTVSLYGMNTSAGIPVLRELWGTVPAAIAQPVANANCKPCREVVGDPLSIAVAKLAINVSLSSRIAWANELAEVCRVVGASVDTVIGAVGGDARIGSAYLKPGWSPAGPCLPRDLDVWCSFGGSYTPIAQEIYYGHMKTRKRIIESVVEWVEKYYEGVQSGKKPIVGVLGLVYNPGAADGTLSQGTAIVDACIRRGWSALGYDPMGGTMFSGVSSYSGSLTLQEVLEKADVSIVATPWPEFDNIHKYISNKPVLRLDGEHSG